MSWVNFMSDIAQYASISLNFSQRWRTLQRTERFLPNISGTDGLFIEIFSGNGLIIVVVVGQFIIAPPSRGILNHCECELVRRFYTKTMTRTAMPSPVTWHDATTPRPQRRVLAWFSFTVTLGQFSGCDNQTDTFLVDFKIILACYVKIMFTNQLHPT